MVREGYKQTEVGVIPEDWNVKPVGEAFEIRNNLRLPISKRVRDSMRGQYPYYGPTSVQDCINEYRVEGEHALIGEDGDHFLKWRDISMTLLVDGKFNVNNHAHIIKGVDNLTSWFYYFFAHKDLTPHLKRQGAGRYKLNKSTLIDIPCAIPPLEEQRSISQALSDVDALIAALDKTIAKKQAIKAATMQQLLTGKKRLPGFGGEWEVKQLRELAHIQRGASPRPIDNPIWFNNNSLVGWVRISDVTRSGMYLRETEQKLSPLGVQHSRPVAKNNLIMSICATVGRPIITEIDVCIHDGFVVFDSLQAVQLFMYYVLKWIEPDWSKHGQTGSQMNLNTELINGTTVHVPPSPEQTAIATVLSDMDTEIAALETRLAKTQALKQGMMQALLTGRVRLV